MMSPSHLTSRRDAVAQNSTVGTPVTLTSISWPEALSPMQSTCCRETPSILTPALGGAFYCCVHSADEETKTPELRTLPTSYTWEVMELGFAGWPFDSRAHDSASTVNTAVSVGCSCHSSLTLKESRKNQEVWALSCSRSGRTNRVRRAWHITGLR